MDDFRSDITSGRVLGDLLIIDRAPLIGVASGVLSVRVLWLSRGGSGRW